MLIYRYGNIRNFNIFYYNISLSFYFYIGVTIGGTFLNIICSLAKQMVDNQSFSFGSFQDAKAKVEHKYRNNSLYIEYDRLSLYIYHHNLTARQYHELGIQLSNLFSYRTIEDKKTRIEYLILFQYLKFHPEYMLAHIAKSLHPDFTLDLDGQTVGIEVTRLEKAADNIMSKIISKRNKPGMKANEVLAAAFKDHGEKIKEYEVFEIAENVLAIHHIESMLISNDEFVKRIGDKIEKYRNLAYSFDRFIILCNAQVGITITSEADATRMLLELNNMCSNIQMTIAVLYLDNNTLCLSEHSFY